MDNKADFLSCKRVTPELKEQADKNLELVQRLRKKLFPGSD